jgi:hypothetical protein
VVMQLGWEPAWYSFLPWLHLWVGVVKKTRPCVSAGSMLSITPQAFWHHSHRLLWFVVMCRVYQHQHGGEDKEPRSSVRALDWGDGQTKLQSIGTLGREEMLRVAFFFGASMSMCAGVVCL